MPNPSNNQNPLDPRGRAHQAGMELARRAGEQTYLPPTSGEMVARGDMGTSSLASFFQEHPLFDQGQTKRQREVTRRVHVISESEYIMTETTIETEVFSFGRDIYMKREGK